ncbi:hypothetical protein PENARI_c092G06562, partial [Penicillium arizonense]
MRLDGSAISSESEVHTALLNVAYEAFNVMRFEEYRMALRQQNLPQWMVAIIVLYSGYTTMRY